MAPLAVIILAAGLGTRMKSSLPKVNHQIAGRSMLGHVQAVAQTLKPEHLITVLGLKIEIYLALVKSSFKKNA